MQICYCVAGILGKNIKWIVWLKKIGNNFLMLEVCWSYLRPLEPITHNLLLCAISFWKFLFKVIHSPPLILERASCPEQLRKCLLLWLCHLHVSTVIGVNVHLTCTWPQDLSPVLNRPNLKFATKSVVFLRVYFISLLHNCRRNSIPTPQQKIELRIYQLVVIRYQSESGCFQCRQSKYWSSSHCCAFNFFLAMLAKLSIQKCTLPKCQHGTIVSTNIYRRSNRIVNACKLIIQRMKFPF